MLFVLHFLQQCLCLGRLLRIGGEDCAAVLRAHVVALAVQSGRIMSAEEDQQHIAQADERGSKSSFTTSAWPVCPVQISS